MENCYQKSSVVNNTEPARRRYGHERRCEWLAACLRAWQRSAPGKRLAEWELGWAICEQVDALGLADELVDHGVPIYQHSDAMARGQAMMRSLWRWLGCTDDCAAQHGHVLLYEQAILAAMPPGVAARYLAGIAPPSLTVCEGHAGESGVSDLTAIIRAVHKEGSEALQALLMLSGEDGHETCRAVMKEVAEAIDSLVAAEAHLREVISESGVINNQI